MITSIETTTTPANDTFTVYDTFVENFAAENDISVDVATKLTDWLGEVGVLDYTEIKNVYDA